MLVSLDRKASLPLVQISGSYDDMGSRLGRRYRNLAKSMLRKAKAAMARKGISWEQAIERSRDYLTYAQEFDPKYIDFLEGYAKGSGLRFQEIFALLCQNEKGLCTDISVNGKATSNGSVLSAHTEDWIPADEMHLVLLHGKPKGDPAFLVMSLGGFELVSGLNSAGISFSGNSLDQTDARVGIPKTFAARRIIASRTLVQAISAAVPTFRGSSYNNNICHSSGEMYCVEASATDSSLLCPRDGYLVHTNHYLDSRMTKYEALFMNRGGWTFENGSGSVVRYNRALRLVRKELGNVDVACLARILSDHVNSPSSICAHVKAGVPPFAQTKTLYGSIVDLSRLEMMICRGNPCEGTFEKYSLR